MQALVRLQKFNVWMEALVSVGPDGHMIVASSHTKLKAYWWTKSYTIEN